MEVEVGGGGEATICKQVQDEEGCGAKGQTMSRNHNHLEGWHDGSQVHKMG